jgi:DNA helicase-2/ATP-dependent DNA helicase PcrA
VLDVEEMGGDFLLEVAFDKIGTKKIMANFAKLEKI